MKATDWKFAVDKERSTILAIAGNDWLHLLLQINVDEQKKYIISNIRLQQSCPEATRRAMAVWCNLKNWGFKFGFISCDPRDGEVTFRDSVDCEHIEITGKFVDNMLRKGLHIMTQNYREMMAIMAGNAQ
jgi:hypothetical protein